MLLQQEIRGLHSEQKKKNTRVLSGKFDSRKDLEKGKGFRLLPGGKVSGEREGSPTATCALRCGGAEAVQVGPPVLSVPAGCCLTPVTRRGSKEK